MLSIKLLHQLQEAHTAWEESETTKPFTIQWLSKNGYETLLQQINSSGVGIDALAEFLPDDLRQDFFASHLSRSAPREPNYKTLLLLLNQQEPITIERLRQLGYTKLAGILSSASPQVEQLLKQLPSELQAQLAYSPVELQDTEVLDQLSQAYAHWREISKHRLSIQFNNIFLEQHYPAIHGWILKNPEKFKKIFFKLSKEIQDALNPHRVVEAVQAFREAERAWQKLEPPKKDFLDWVKTHPEYQELVGRLERDGLLPSVIALRYKELELLEKKKERSEEVTAMWREGITRAFRRWQEESQQGADEPFTYIWLRDHGYKTLFFLKQTYPMDCMMPPQEELERRDRDAVQQGAKTVEIVDYKRRDALKKSPQEVMTLHNYFRQYIEKRLLNDFGYIAEEDVDDIQQSFWERMFTPGELFYPVTMSDIQIASLQSEQATEAVLSDKVLAEVMKRLYAHVSVWIRKYKNREKQDRQFGAEAAVIFPHHRESNPDMRLDVEKFFEAHLTPLQVELLDFVDSEEGRINVASSEHEEGFLDLINKMREETGKTEQGRSEMTMSKEQQAARFQFISRTRRHIKKKGEKFFRSSK